MSQAMLRKLPLYLLLGVPTAYACVEVMGDGMGLLVGCVANLALWHILLMPADQEEQEGTRS